MSDCMTQNNLSGFWAEIVNVHWNFLFTEESRKKLDTRKNLEDYLKEFLALVPHDRKFCLRETKEVLKNSIRDLDDFSAQKAITAFDWISQYANNLLIKPWRKEFRMLKMYSGFYQHEIKANLLNAEILFLAMGYRRISDDILILDEPICPDQLANVSRDAMAAYVELQIIKHIYAGLDAVDLGFSLWDIYQYREKHIGNISQTVQALAYSVEEKRHRSKQKALMADNYGFIDVQTPSNYFSINAHHCAAQCQCEHFQQYAPVLRHRTTAQPNGICCVREHRQPSFGIGTNLAYSNLAENAQYQYNRQPAGMTCGSDVTHLPHMSHSRSLEHYNEAPHRNHNILPQRHSFDHQLQECNTARQYYSNHLQKEQQQQQQQNYYQHVTQHQQNLYESPYDYIDGNSTGGGSSNISYAAVAATNAATARTRACANNGIGSSGTGYINCNSNSSTTYSHPYNTFGNRVALPLHISNQLHGFNNPDFSSYSHPQVPSSYDRVSKYQMYTTASNPSNPNYMINTNENNVNSNTINGSQNQQLINFKDINVLQPATQQPHSKYGQSIEISNEIMDNHYNICNGLEKSLPPSLTSTGQQYCVSGKPLSNGDMYAKPTARDIRSQNELNLGTFTYNSGEREDTTTDMSCESAKEETLRKDESNKRSISSSVVHYPRTYDVSSSSGHNVHSLNMESLNINKASSSTCSQNSMAAKLADYTEFTAAKQLQLLETNEKHKSSDNENSSLSIKHPCIGSQNEFNLPKFTYNSDECKETTKTGMSCESAKEQTFRKDESNQRSISSSLVQYPKTYDAASSSAGHSSFKDIDKLKHVSVHSLNMESLNKDSCITSSQSSAVNKLCDYTGNENASGKQKQILETNEKNKSSENENSSLSINSREKSNAIKCNKKNSKTAFKQNTSANPIQRKTNDNNKFANATNNGNNNESLKRPGNKNYQRKNSPLTAAVNTNKSLANDKKNTSTITPKGGTGGAIVTSASTWSCAFCTFDNPSNKRICEMCYHSQGFEMESSNTLTTTAKEGATVAHNAPTCV